MSYLIQRVGDLSHSVQLDVEFDSNANLYMYQIWDVYGNLVKEARGFQTQKEALHAGKEYTYSILDNDNKKVYESTDSEFLELL